MLGVLFLALGFAALGMAFDLDAFFTGTLAESHQQGTALTAMADRNLTQGLGIIYGAIIEQNSVAADPALISALQTASRAPVQGSNELPK
jgi:hypothetical protein